MNNTAIAIIYLAWIGLFSLVTFVVYWADKIKAKKHGEASRIRESVLLLLAAYGGAPGAFLGRICFRHKTQKIYFSIVILWSLVLQSAVGVLLLMLAKGWLSL